MNTKRTTDHRSAPRRKSIPRRAPQRRHPRRRKHAIVWRRFLPALVCIVVMLYSLIRVVDYGVNSLSRRRTIRNVQQIYQEALPKATPSPTQTPPPMVETTPEAKLLTEYQYIGKTPLPRFRDLLDENDDTVGWLNIPGVVNLPVVYDKTRFYLDHNFYGEEDKAGTLFLDPAHPPKAGTQHLLIHGHDMHDGSMFGLLTHYRNKDFLLQHTKVYWTTLFRSEVYEVFAVLIVPEDPNHENYVPYAGRASFHSVEQFNDYIHMIEENAKYFNGEHVNPSDALLSLSTCIDSNRIVVMCRRIEANTPPS